MFQRVTQLGLNFHIQSFLMMKCFPFLLIFHDFSTPTSFSEAPRTIVLHRWRILQGLDIYRVFEMRTWFFQIKNGYRVKPLFQLLLSQKLILLRNIAKLIRLTNDSFQFCPQMRPYQISKKGLSQNPSHIRQQFAMEVG